MLPLICGNGSCYTQTDPKDPQRLESYKQAGILTENDVDIEADFHGYTRGKMDTPTTRLAKESHDTNGRQTDKQRQPPTHTQTHDRKARQTSSQSKREETHR